MTENELYRQIAEQTGEDYQTIERLGFTPVVPRYRCYAKRRFRKRRKSHALTSPATSSVNFDKATDQHGFSRMIPMH